MMLTTKLVIAILLLCLATAIIDSVSAASVMGNPNIKNPIAQNTNDKIGNTFLQVNHFSVP